MPPRRLCAPRGLLACLVLAVYSALQFVVLPGGISIGVGNGGVSLLTLGRDSQPSLRDLLGRTNETGYGLIFRGKLFVTGVRLTVDESGDASVDVFSIPKEKLYHIKRPWANFSLTEAPYPLCAMNSCSLWESMLDFKAAASFLTSCSIQGSAGGQFGHVPILTTDINRRRLMHIFRCPIKKPIAMFGPLSSFAVEITNQHGRSQFFSIPAHNLALAEAGPANFSPKPLLNWQRHLITLCVGGIQKNGVEFVGHFIRHHLHLGVDHFMLGVLFGTDDPMYATLVNSIRDYLNDGSVVIISLRHTMHFLPRFDALEYFHNACLYHAKSVSEYVGAWDVDEWWFPLRANESLAGSLAGLLKRDLASLDFCFVSFPAYVMHGHDARWGQDPTKLLDGGVRSRRTGMPLLDFPFRDSNFNFIYRKSIARTRNAFLSTSHVFGSCRTPPVGNDSSSSIAKQGNWYSLPRTKAGPEGGSWTSNSAVTLNDTGAMRHFFPLFHSDVDLWAAEGGRLLNRSEAARWAVDLIIPDEWSERARLGTLYSRRGAPPYLPA